jgi:arylsulfatase A-like enzyme
VAVIAVVGIASSVLFIPNLAQAQQRPPQAQPAQAQAQQQTARPNILVIFGDDVGQSNISAYSHGLVGYKTPNIDRIAKEGMMFTDYYAENHAQRAFNIITGQVCLAYWPLQSWHSRRYSWLQDRDITIAQALKPLGYATGQFGKNHLGDRDEFLPTKARLRRVLRQSLPPQRRGGARATLLSEERYRFRQVQFAPWRSQVVGRWQDRGHRTSEPQADGDDRRRDHGSGDRLHDEASASQPAVFHLDEHHPHACLHPRAGIDARPKRHARQRIC